MISIERTYDRARILAIMHDPIIWDSVSEDDFKKPDFKPDIVADCWLIVLDGDCDIGVYCVHVENGTTLEMHIHILPDHRKRCAYLAQIRFFEWFLEEAPKDYNKLIAKIPSIFSNVKSFAERNGMNLEGTSTDSYRKNGKLCDRWLMGMTRKDVEKQLCLKSQNRFLATKGLTSRRPQSTTQTLTLA